MAKRAMRQIIPLLALSVAFACGTFCGDAISHAAGHKGHHAAHGGILNVIGKEAGHGEIRLTDGLLELWFVGGGNDTHRAVPWFWMPRHCFSPERPKAIALILSLGPSG